MDLNVNQLKAVKHKSGPLLIIAGAGTGKTKVITERIAYLIEKKLAKPSEILALTFTEKAANEMQERVDMLVPIGYEYPTISTFHSFADKLLKNEGVYIGIDPNYHLMTQSEGYIFFRRHIYDLPLNIFRPLGNPTKFISSILTHFSRLQDEDVTPSDYLSYANKYPDITEEESESKKEYLELAKVYQEYTDLKMKNSRLDFGDLITTLVKLFRTKKNILKKYHEKYKYILVDEYQDTNYTQNILVNLLALGCEEKKASKTSRKSANITVVGDDDQSIYKFRGAAISNILQFKQVYPDAKTVVLTDNYRSNQSILNTAYTLITKNNPARLEVSEGVDKRLVAQKKGSNTDLKVLRADTSSYEADLISNEILILTGKANSYSTEIDSEGQSSFLTDGSRYSFKDIAILARANDHLDEIVQSLRYHGIPYKLGGARSLYNRPEIQRYISLIKVLIDYTDEVAMFNLLSMSVWNFTPRDIVEIVRKARNLNVSTFEILEKIEQKEIEIKLSDGGLDGNNKLINTLKECIEKVTKGGDIGRALFYFFENSGLKDLYLSEDSGKYYFESENTKKFFEMVNQYFKNNKESNLYEYYDYLKYSIEVGESPNVDSEAFEDLDAVNVLTIHSSKGLEFPIVFLVNMVSDRFPSRDRKDVIPIPEGLIKETGGGEDDNSHIMEERRLCYVAITRAKEKLYLTAADFYSQGKRKKKLSNFIYEAVDSSKIPQNPQKNPENSFGRLEEPTELLDYSSLGLKPRNIFSYTQLHSFEICPAQYKYEYVLGLPVPISSALSFGSTVHNTLKQVYDQHKRAKEGFEGFNQYPSIKEALEVFQKNWISVGYEDKKQEEIRFKSGKELFKNYFKNLYREDDEVLYLEKEFDYGIDDFRIKGRIDRIDVVRREGKDTFVEIIDYKTGKAKDSKEMSKEWQLLLYSIYVEEILGLKVEKASYIFVEHGLKVEVQIDMKKKKIVLQQIKDIVEKIRKGDFSLPAGHSCDYCKYKEICEDAII